jgi:dTMP kinase
MSHYPGKFIVIDGTDGSGKTTQLQLLAGKLTNEGYEVELADFPQYNSKSAGMVEEYLSGKYGEADSVNPYAASLFYSVDRFDASFQIREWLQAGKVVISNRYISSSFAHQGGKIENPLERKLFFNWLSEIEYKIFNIPKPDLYLILHVEAEISQKLAKGRQREDWHGKTKDIHEDNLDHLKKAENIYLEIAQSMPDFRLIKCTRNGEIMKREDISYLIWLYTKRIFNIDDNQKKKPDFQAVSDILIKNGKLSPNLSEHHQEQIISQGPENSPSFSNSSLEEEVAMELKKLENESRQQQKQFKNVQEIIIERIKPTAKLPTRAHPSDAGLDLYATENISIPPYGQDSISTGIKIAIPKDHVGLIWDKSGLANQGYTTLGGVIDSGYRGEIKVIFKNLSEDIYHIQEGQKIAQILIQKIETPLIKEAPVEDDTDRGQNGFGSTGNH